MIRVLTELRAKHAGAAAGGSSWGVDGEGRFNIQYSDFEDRYRFGFFLPSSFLFFARLRGFCFAWMMSCRL